MAIIFRKAGNEIRGKGGDHFKRESYIDERFAGVSRTKRQKFP